MNLLGLQDIRMLSIFQNPLIIMIVIMTVIIIIICII